MCFGGSDNAPSAVAEREKVVQAAAAVSPAKTPEHDDAAVAVVADTSKPCCNTNGRPTMIIFDWDDTLFATSALKEFMDCSPEEIRQAPKHPVWDQSCLALQSCVVPLLRNALAMAPDLVYIITNSVEGWVEACIERYFPEVTQLLEKVHVVSARQYFMDHHSSGNPKIVSAPLLRRQQQQNQQGVTVTDCLRWKALTFTSLAMEVWNHNGQPQDGDEAASGGGNPVNVVSIGDSPIDHSAARFLERFLPVESWVKTVQLTQIPSWEQLRDQQRLLVNSLRRIIDHPASATLWMSRRPMAEGAEQVNQEAESSALDEVAATMEKRRNVESDEKENKANHAKESDSELNNAKARLLEESETTTTAVSL